MCDNAKQRGSVLIMAIILGSGMLVAAVEISMFVASTIRQARAIDHTLVAFYAAESGVENALHQIRKEERTTLRSDSAESQEGIYARDQRDARWTFLKDGVIDPEKFSPTVQNIKKTQLGEQSSLDVHLWGHTGTGFLEQNRAFATMNVRWKTAECLREGDVPWIETTALVFDVSADATGNGRGITWSDDVQSSPVKKDFTKPDDDVPNSVTIDLAVFRDQGALAAEKGMTLRVKPFFCSLRDVEISFPHKDRPGELVPIPSYYLINPTAAYGSVSTNLSVVMPKYEGATGIFDYLFFTEGKVEKVEE